MEEEIRKLFECEQGIRKCFICVRKDKCQYFKVAEYIEGIPYEIKDNNLSKAFSDLIDIMNEPQCIDIDFGSYDCYEETDFGFSVDKCLVYEINQLNNMGIKTIGCCCGHGK